MVGVIESVLCSTIKVEQLYKNKNTIYCLALTSVRAERIANDTQYVHAFQCILFRVGSQSKHRIAK